MVEIKITKHSTNRTNGNKIKSLEQLSRFPEETPPGKKYLQNMAIYPE